MSRPVTLHQWQKDCLRIWEANHYHGIINVATGAGKTFAALAAMEKLRKKTTQLRVKVVVPSIALANQWKQALLQNAEDESLLPGFYGGGKHDDPTRKVLIYIVNTARTSLSAHIRSEFALGHPVFLICDECHHYQSQENRKIFDFLSGSSEFIKDLYYCMGLSATPFHTGDNSILKQALGNEIFTYGFHEAVAHGIISPFYICQVSVSFLAKEAAEYASLTREVHAALEKLLRACPYMKTLSKTAFMKEASRLAKKCNMDPSDPAALFLLKTFQRKEVSLLALSRLLCCINLIQSLPSDSRILIFCERIEQAEKLYRMLLRRFGPIGGLYHSEMIRDARNRILKNFHDGGFRILVTCRCLDEGIDVPDADVGIVISSSSVSRQRIQRLGRIIRKSKHKSYACLYYLFVREATDSRIYLDNISGNQLFDLHYSSAEDALSNDLYEYAAAALLANCKKNTSDADRIRELRTCLLEGLTRPDYLLDIDAQRKNQRQSHSIHQKNYWNVMERLGTWFR